ncbi:MAG: peptide chain release factor 1 [Bacteroidia bacterium]|nr:peptide chain release factor 1 [Bacteroidia bacterium]MCX7651458.1 peptide chain release factor 1 [Bacteroidia bacterium]MDW8416787.1 peptide chain release factor 1 [Bacteroidia bacterium]
MWERLEQVKKRFLRVEEELSRGVEDPVQLRELGREHKYLAPIVSLHERWLRVHEALTHAKEELESTRDPEWRAIVSEEVDRLSQEKVDIEQQLKIALLPPDPDDDKSVILEIRAGTGGDEAALFAGDLARMYQRYIERRGWKWEVSDFTEGNAGGYKELIMLVRGEGAYGWLKYEGGVHRVQRIPQTESQGRIHTSAASVAVLPEPEDIDIQIKESDIRKDTYCSSGHGGQSVNTTYSAVRLVHIPTGITVAIQNERSQIKNYETALRILKARLYEMELQKRQAQEEALRRSYISTGDRSAKIRTYNFPQNRVTDHRIGLTLYELDRVMDGELDELLAALRLADQTQRLAQLEAQAG